MQISCNFQLIPNLWIQPTFYLESLWESKTLFGLKSRYANNILFDTFNFFFTLNSACLASISLKPIIVHYELSGDCHSYILTLLTGTICLNLGEPHMLSDFAAVHFNNFNRLCGMNKEGKTLWMNGLFMIISVTSRISMKNAASASLI